MTSASNVNWSELSGREIYDRFTAKGSGLGTQANKVIRLLKERNYFPESASKILAKNKNGKVAQRTLFHESSARCQALARISAGISLSSKSVDL